MKIIANAHVITCDPDNNAGQLHLLISENRIAEISENLDLLTSQYPYATIVDASNKLITPGFVNAHFHSESILLRTRTDGLHRSLWKSDLRTQESINGLLDPLNHDDVRNVYHMSYFSHLKSGTTCVGEFGLPFGDASFGKMLAAIDRTEVKNVVTLQNWDQIVRAGESADKRHHFLVNVGRPEDFTVYSFENLTRAAKELKVPLIAHVGEQRIEEEFVKRVFRRNIFEVLNDYAVAVPQTVFVHANHFNNQEVGALSLIDASVVVCARSAAFKRTGYPALRYHAEHKVRMAVGTDWGNVDMLDELRFLRQLHLLISGIPHFSTVQLIRMGTINGAMALGLSHETGSIEVGKKADLAFFSLDDMRLPIVPENATAEFLSTLLIDYLTNRDVSDVMIDGEFYVAKGQVMTMAEEEILGNFRTTHAKFYQDSVTISPSTVSAAFTTSMRPDTKILPFTSNGRTSRQLDEGFESGFRSGEKSTPAFGPKEKIVRPQSPAPPISDAESSPGKEDPQNANWLTFGEDEDF